MPPAFPRTTFSGASSENFLESAAFMSPVKRVLSPELTETHTGLLASIVSSKGIDPSLPAGATGSGFFASSPNTLSAEGSATGLAERPGAPVVAAGAREEVSGCLGVTDGEGAGK